MTTIRDYGDVQKLSELQRGQLLKWGQPFNCTAEQRRRAVMDCSVYNALSHGRADRTVAELVAILDVAWQPRPGWLSDDHLNRDTIADSARRLVKLGLVELDGATVRLPLRDPAGHGPPVVVDYISGTLRSKHAC